MEITGTLINVLAKIKATSKAGKEFQTRQFVIETEDEKYPKKIAFDSFNDKSDLLDDFKLGQKVNVHFSIESNEYNGKWYTKLGLWKIEVLGGQKVNPAPQTDPFLLGNDAF